MSFRIEKRILSALLAAAALLSFGLLTASAEAKKPKPVSVFPAPKTPVASDETTFSFRGLKPKNLGKVKVIGSKTGQVGHTRLRHSDGRGVSIVPKKAFQPGEKVRVYTKKRIKLANKGPRGDLQTHGRKLQRDTLAVIQNAKARFPHLRIAYLSSRIYGGYSSGPLNPCRMMRASHSGGPVTHSAPASGGASPAIPAPSSP